MTKLFPGSPGFLFGVSPAPLPTGQFIFQTDRLSTYAYHKSKLIEMGQGQRTRKQFISPLTDLDVLGGFELQKDSEGLGSWLSE